MTKNTSPNTRPAGRKKLPEHLRRTRIDVTLSPEAIKLLEPYLETGRRSEIIDAAIKEFLQPKSKYTETYPYIPKSERK